MTTEATTDPVGAARTALGEFDDHYSRLMFRARDIHEHKGSRTGLSMSLEEFRTIRAGRELADALPALLAHVAALEADSRRKEEELCALGCLLREAQERGTD